MDIFHKEELHLRIKIIKFPSFFICTEVWENQSGGSVTGFRTLSDLQANSVFQRWVFYEEIFVQLSLLKKYLNGLVRGKNQVCANQTHCIAFRFLFLNWIEQNEVIVIAVINLIGSVSFLLSKEINFSFMTSNSTHIYFQFQDFSL